MKKKMTKRQAHKTLHAMWENGEIPSNFTEDYSEYDRAIEQIMEFGCLTWEDFF
jgi:hypothetical protein